MPIERKIKRLPCTGNPPLTSTENPNGCGQRLSENWGEPTRETEQAFKAYGRGKANWRQEEIVEQVTKIKANQESTKCLKD